jgi:hypothetical protein
MSNLALAVQQVLGVIDVKITTSSEDADDYGVEIYHDATDPTPEIVQTTDFKFDDATLPIFLSATILRRAAP